MNVNDLTMDEVTLKINELSKKSKTAEGLTDEEKELQKAVRQRYIDAVKGNLRSQLNGIEYKKKK